MSDEKTQNFAESDNAREIVRSPREFANDEQPSPSRQIESDFIEPIENLLQNATLGDSASSDRGAKARRVTDIFERFPKTFSKSQPPARGAAEPNAPRGVVVAERVIGQRIVGVNELPPRVQSEKVSLGASRVVREVELGRCRRSRTLSRSSAPARAVQPIEIVTQRPIPIIRTVDVPYDVVVDVPIERTIEREIITELTVARDIERVFEVSAESNEPKPENGQFTAFTISEENGSAEVRIPRVIHHYREHPITRTIDRPTQTGFGLPPPADLIREVVEPVERVVERSVDFEVVVERNVEVIVERVVEVPVEKIIEVPVIVRVQKPIYVERVIEEFGESEPELEALITQRQSELEIARRFNAERREALIALNAEIDALLRANATLSNEKDVIAELRAAVSLNNALCRQLTTAVD